MKKILSSALAVGIIFSTLALALPALADAQTVTSANAQVRISYLESQLQVIESTNTNIANSYANIQAQVSYLEGRVQAIKALNDQSGGNTGIQSELNAAESELQGIASQAANISAVGHLRVLAALLEIKIQVLQLQKAL